MARQPFRISAFREMVGMVNYITSDFAGHTRREKLRIDLRTKYQPELTRLESMLPKLELRYEDDWAKADLAIKRAYEKISLNEGNQLSAISEGITHNVYNPAPRLQETLIQCTV